MEVSMGEITKSRAAMIIAAFAAIAYVFGTALVVVAYAVLTPGNLGTATDFRHAADWLHFIGVLAAFVGVGAAGWELLLKGRLVALLGVGAAIFSTFLLAIGALVNAAFPSSDAAANVLTAIGIGGWAFIALVTAAHRSLIEHAKQLLPPHQAALWLSASAGLLFLAIGAGMTVGPLDQGLGIASGLLQALGAGILAATLAIARRDRFLLSRSVPLAIGGLVVGAFAFVIVAIVAGIVFTPSGTLVQLRVGLSVAATVLLCAVAMLGVAAWLRAKDLSASLTSGPSP
jgi:hypothetical protein